VIQAGEATGHLAPVLKKVIAYLEEKRAIRKKMISSMVYPSFVSLVAILVVILFLTVLLPQIEGMLERLGGEMTWSARLLIDGSNVLLQFGPFLLIALVLTVVGIKQWKTTRKGTLFLDALFLKIPLIGKIIYYSNLYQTGNLIATLLQSGINTTETLQLTEKTIVNHSLKEKFIIAKTQVNEGVSLTQAFRIQKFMPDIALDVLGVGEDTGDLANSMEEVTVGFKEQLSNRLNQMTTIVSSLALGFAFSLVTLIAIGIVTSIFQVSKSLSL
jgi:type II secretory pathway component PulF